jgi:hypothetical protein
LNGVEGSGKTHTLVDKELQEQSLGIIPRAVEWISTLSDDAINCGFIYNVSMIFLEVYFCAQEKREYFIT